MKKIVLLLLGCCSILTLSACKYEENPVAQSSQSQSDSAVNHETDTNEYEEVDITLENYQEYFEITQHFYADTDDFGDYTGQMWYGVYFALKDGFDVDTGYGKSSVKIKYESTTSHYGFTFSKETGDWKLGEAYLKYDDVWETSVSLGELEYFKYAAPLSINEYIAGQPNEEFLYGGKYKYSVEIPDNINIKKIMGTLYVKKAS